MIRMAEDLKRHFLHLLKMVDGLNAIVITDRDGVPVLKVANEHAPELALKARFLATAAMTIEQASKLGVSTNKNMISMYKHHQVISLNKHPFIVNMIATASANTGLILSLEPDMLEALDDIRSAVDGS